MTIGTKSSITSMCKNFVLIAKIQKTYIRHHNHHQKSKPKVNQIPVSFIKIYSLRKSIKGSSLTLFPECFSDVWIYIIREVMMSNIEVTIVMYILVIITSIIIYSSKTRILHKNKMANVPKDLLKVYKLVLLLIWLIYLNFNT